MGFRSSFNSPFAAPFGETEDFAARLVSIYGAAEVWKLTDITSGTTIPAYVDSVRNGVLQGWDLQNTASPIVGDSGLAPYSDAVNDFGNIYTSNGSTGLVDIFDDNLGAMLVAIKVDAAAWTDGQNRRAFSFSSVAPVHLVSILKSSTNNRLTVTRIDSASSKSVNITTSSTAWLMVMVTWNVASDRMRVYLNGAQQGADVTGLGAFSAALNASRCCIGAQTVTPLQSFQGAMAFATLWCGIEPSAADALAIYTDATT